MILTKDMPDHKWIGIITEKATIIGVPPPARWVRIAGPRSFAEDKIVGVVSEGKPDATTRGCVICQRSIAEASPLRVFVVGVRDSAEDLKYGPSHTKHLSSTLARIYDAVERE